MTDDVEEETIPGLGGVLLADVEQAIKERDSVRAQIEARDKRICMCGHPARAHSGMQGAKFCKPTKMECPCRTMEAVLLVQDTRQFLWSTVGYGPQHALSRGIGSCIQKKKTYEWLIDLKCRICEKETDDLAPCSVTPGVQVATRPEKLNGLLCRDCIENIGVVEK